MKASSSIVGVSSDAVFDPKAPRPGMRLSQYKLLQKLGEGGMGSVWKALHTLLDKVVAIKLLSEQFVDDPRLVARFEREMKAVGRLEHANLVRALDAGHFDGTRYLVMDFIDGVDLATYVRKHGPMESALAVRLIEQAARGLATAHAAGLVHRDIKPGNLMLTADGQLKVTDLGLALLANEAAIEGDTQSLTSQGMILGTPDYMAPEQWGNTHEVDTRCDLYSLGCTLFFLLTGVAPYWDRHGPAAKMQAHITLPPPDLMAARSAWALTQNGGAATVVLESPSSPPLQAIIHGLLAKSPGDRYQNCAALIADLAPLLASESTTLPLLSTTLSLGTATMLPQHSRPGRLTKPLWIGAGLVAVAILAAGIWNWDSRSGDSGKMVAIASRLKDSRERNSGAPKKSAANPTKKIGWRDWPTDAPAPAISPYDEVRAYRFQEAWARYLDLPIEFTNSLGMKFRLIPPGEFTRGSSPEEIEETIRAYGELYPEIVPTVRSSGPQHRCVIGVPFYMGVHEVTQQQYERVMGTNPSYFSPLGAGRMEIMQEDTSQFPVEQVTWFEQAVFCSKLAEREGVSARYVQDLESVKFLGGPGYRIPSEAEWEFACRAGTTTRFWAGSTEQALDRVSWWAKNSAYITHAVGQLTPNPFGLFDVHGNVSEPSEDAAGLDDYLTFRSNPAEDPLIPFTSSTERAVRGGCCVDIIWQNAGHRRFMNAHERTQWIGIRVALGVDAVRTLLKKGAKPPASAP
jgi:serine/threonine protein kinase